MKRNTWKIKNIVKLQIIVITQGNIDVLRIAYVILKYSVPKRTPIIFHNRYNYDYHFVIKELAVEFKKQFTSLGENTKKYITLTAPVEKEVTRIDKNGEEIIKHIAYILQFTDSTRFMASSLSNIVNNISEGIYRVKCKYGHDQNNVKLAELHISIATVFLNTWILKMIQ